MNTVHELWDHIRGKVARALGQLGIDEMVEPVPPPSPEFGHLGFPVFSFARVLRKAPPLIAQEVAALIETDHIVREVTTLKGYVNLFLDEQALGRVLLPALFSQQFSFAANGLGKQYKTVLEYSAPNTNKPLHLGHIRNNLLGLAVSNILAYHGQDMVRVNLINDRGIHISKTMLAYQKWGEGQTPESVGMKGDHFVGNLYVRFDRELKKELETWRAREGSSMGEDEYFNAHSELGALTHQILRKWEDGDQDTVALWKQMNRWVMDGFQQTYQRMGCAFDLVQYESDTYKLGKKLVDQGLNRGLFERRDDGAVTFDLARAGMEGHKVLLRSDGTSLYMTQDLGTAMERIERFSPDQLVYVVGDEQIYHFNVLFKILDLLKPGIGERCHHLAYGMVRLPEGKMKSREGTVVDADDLMDQLRELAREELQGRADLGGEHHEGISPQEIELRSERIAQAALKFFIFRFTPRKSFEYDPKRSIDFTGQTGPYCLYTYARTRSLVRRSGWEPEYREELVHLLTEPAEGDVLRQIFDFPNVVAHSAAALDPSKIADWVYNLAASFARMFNDRANYPIATCEDPELRQARLMLAHAVGIAVRSALELLGIEVLEEM